MSESKPTRRWFSPTPGWLVLFSLATTGLLYLSERFQGFPFNHRKGWTVLVAVAAAAVVLLLMLAWYVAALLLRRRFQFSLRSLLVIGVALPFSWLAVEMRGANDQRTAVEAIVKAGRLNLSWTEITDAGLDSLKCMSELEELDLQEKLPISDEAVKRLQQALPNCKIIN